MHRHHDNLKNEVIKSNGFQRIISQSGSTMASSAIFLCANACLTGDQKKTLFSFTDRELHDALRVMIDNSQQPTEDLRDSNIEIAQNFKVNVMNRLQKLTNREKKTILAILTCLISRSAVGISKSLQRIQQHLSGHFELPEEVESDVSL